MIVYKNKIKNRNGRNGRISEYDKFGNVIKVTYPSGDVNSYEYDQFGNVI